jgi:hypothetical protein
MIVFQQNETKDLNKEVIFSLYLLALSVCFVFLFNLKRFSLVMLSICELDDAKENFYFNFYKDFLSRN